MNKETAERLAGELSQLDDVSSADVVHFTDHGEITHEPPERHDSPDDDLYGVDYL